MTARLTIILDDIPEDSLVIEIKGSVHPQDAGVGGAPAGSAPENIPAPDSKPPIVTKFTGIFFNGENVLGEHNPSVTRSLPFRGGDDGSRSKPSEDAIRAQKETSVAADRLGRGRVFQRKSSQAVANLETSADPHGQAEGAGASDILPDVPAPYIDLTIPGFLRRHDGYPKDHKQ